MQQSINEKGRAAGRIRNASDVRARKKHAMLARRARKGFKIAGGKVQRMTAKERRARMRGVKRLIRARGTATGRRAAARTRKFNKKFLRDSVIVHSAGFLNAVNEFVQFSNRPDIGAAIIEGTDPRLTSTPVGLYALTVHDQLAEQTEIRESLVDVMVLDEKANTIAVFFEASDLVNEDNLTRALREHGEVECLTVPGAAIDEANTADLYMFAVTIPTNRLDDVKVHEDVQLDENGEVVIDESTIVTVEEARALFGDSCFEDIVNS